MRAFRSAAGDAPERTFGGPERVGLVEIAQPEPGVRARFPCEGFACRELLAQRCRRSDQEIAKLPEDGCPRLDCAFASDPQQANVNAD